MGYAELRQGPPDWAMKVLEYSDIIIDIKVDIIPHDIPSLDYLKYNQLFHLTTSCHTTFYQRLWQDSSVTMAFSKFP